jgi:CelD/BcsL family acetyltransferase involved in cellulose biosynthesis
MTYNVRWTSSAADWRALRDDWEGAAGNRSPFARHAWHDAWFATWARETAPVVCTTWRQGELVAGLPFVRSRGRLLAPVNGHVPLVDGPLHDPAAGYALARAVVEAVPAMLADGLPLDGTLAREFVRAARETHALVAQHEGHVSPIVETDGDYGDWRRESKPRWHAPLERFRRKLGREHDARWDLIVSPTDLGPALERGFAVEGSGWKARCGTAINSSPETRSFYFHVAEAFHQLDELRLSWCELADGWAAFDLCVLMGGRLWLLKTGFEERHRRLAPGLVLRLSVIGRCFELGLDAHELLGTDSEWKLKFATTDRRHVRLHVARRDLRGSTLTVAERSLPVLAQLNRNRRRVLSALRARVSARAGTSPP